MPQDDEDTVTPLAAAWAVRDDQYARNPQFLDNDAIRAIRRYRVSEAEELPLVPLNGPRMELIQRARHWWPPEHGQ